MRDMREKFGIRMSRVTMVNRLRDAGIAWPAPQMHVDTQTSAFVERIAEILRQHEKDKKRLPPTSSKSQARLVSA